MDGITVASVDIITLAFARGIMQMMLGGLLFYLGTRELNDRAATWWALGFLVNGLSLFSFAIDVPETWLPILSTFNHLSLGAAAVFFLIGFWRFGKQPIKPWFLVLMMVLPVISIVAWEVLWPNARYRVLCTAAGQVLYLLALQLALNSPPREELARIYRRLRYAVIIYLVIFIWSYASIAELLPTTARQSLDYHRAIFSIASLLFMLTLAVSCLAMKFTLLAARNADVAKYDWLTGLLNRRGFFSSIESRPHFTDKKTSLLSIDIDHFKSINDEYGHAAGDEVLQNFGNLLKSYDQENRLVTRMGGEEFLVTLFDTPAAEAVELAEEIRCTIEHNEVTLNNRKPVAFTVSIGVYTLTPTDAMEQALAKVDQVLYQAKRKGRNQVAFN